MLALRTGVAVSCQLKRLKALMEEDGTLRKAVEKLSCALTKEAC